MIKETFIGFFLIFLPILTVGCEKIGYIVTIDTSHIKYGDLKEMERTLEGKGFETKVTENKKGKSGFSHEVYILLEKKLSDQPYHVVAVDLNYVKDLPNNMAQNLRIEISNVYKGMTIIELKDEIDKIGDLLYQGLAGKLGKERVIIKREAIHHCLIFF